MGRLNEPLLLPPPALEPVERGADGRRLGRFSFEGLKDFFMASPDKTAPLEREKYGNDLIMQLMTL
jgi:hypothetical protein